MQSPKRFWYSRDALWTFATSRNCRSVADLTDVEYIEGLSYVDEYYRKHVSQLAARRLVRFAGPQNLTDRGALCEQSLGGICELYRDFAAPVFADELRRLDPLVTPTTCCEQQFMQALKSTDLRMRYWRACSDSGALDWYRGPQSYIHRVDLDRMNFVSARLSGAVPKPRSPQASESLHWLACGKCSNWRRVDASTAKVYSNVNFLKSPHMHKIRKFLNN